MAFSAWKHLQRTLRQQHIKQEVVFPAAFPGHRKLRQGAFLAARLNPLGGMHLELSANLKLEGPFRESLQATLNHMVQQSRGEPLSVSVSTLSAGSTHPVDLPKVEDLINDLTKKPLTGVNVIKRAAKDVLRWFSKPMERGKRYPGRCTAHAVACGCTCVLV
jgi:hypothetical protein